MSSADQSSFFDPLPLANFSADAEDDKALRIEGHDDLFTLRSFLGGDDDETSLLDSFDVEESFFDVPEDVIADLETIPEIDESAMFSAPVSDLTHAVKRLSMDCTSTFVATQTFSSCSSPSSPSAPSQSHGSCQVSEAFAQCMRNSSQSREQLNLWQEQIRQNSSASTSSTNTSASSERKRSHSTIEQSTTASPNGSSNSSVEATLPYPKRQARPETVICTAQFLCGSRPTLTAALEQSRKALKEYMLRAKCA